MKIESLEITKLYNLYDYDVKFNSDLTFLYGNNGCGKTTILNIIESIVSGRIFDLYMWDFEKIRLNYYDDESLNSEKFSINISYNNENICITFKKVNRTIKKDDFLRYCEEADSYEGLFQLMVARYEFLETIQKEFNYVYLPLNRNSTSISDAKFYRKFLRSIRHRYYRGNYYEHGPFREDEIGKTAYLVQKSYAEASALVSVINDEFRNRVLKSLLGTNAHLSNDEFFKFLVASTREKDIDSLKGQYFKLLDSLELLDDTEKEKYNQFFQDYKHQVRSLVAPKKRDGAVSFPFSLIYDYHEIEKIKTVIPLAQEAEEKKAAAFRKIKLFEDTMNSFICSEDGEKKLYIDEKGEIKFSSLGKETTISITNLSSGEKQLLIFFANLVFNVDDSLSSIFVVDEPELSLHLNWQRKFVEKAIEVNRNMQLILATHAPEIVGKNRNKMYKLEKRLHESI